MVVAGQKSKVSHHIKQYFSQHSSHRITYIHYRHVPNFNTKPLRTYVQPALNNHPTSPINTESRAQVACVESLYESLYDPWDSHIDWCVYQDCMH